MVAVNSTLLGTNAVTTTTLTFTNINPAGVGHVIVLCGRMQEGSGDATPTITDSVDGATGWTSIVLARNPFADWNFAGRAWIKAAWSGNRNILITGGANPVGNNAIIVHATAVDPTTPIGGIIGMTVNIGDGAETLTLSAAPRTEDITIAMVINDSDNAATVTWGSGFTEPNSTWQRGGPSGSGAASFCVAVRGTGSTSTSVPITDSQVGGGTFYSSNALAFVLRAAEEEAENLDLRVNDAGTWRDVLEYHVNDAGTWTPALEVHKNISGTWTRIW